MCLILDANKYSGFLNPKDEDMEPVRDWLRRKNGKIVYAPTARLQHELDNCQPMRRIFDEYSRAGQVKMINEKKVGQVASQITGLVSDDEHIIALAIVSKTKLLVSGDKKLHADFRKKIKGRIYQNKRHRHLLKKDTCP